ncbi:hypothetical protein BB559_004873 [Furculomyces boomerangus]|uniref:Large ribosomal subunit protein uL3m n=1 Tax=Furculomyces boomerangus TaxID=61424 RepID=A0A2T9YC33_9FUNG|nr:hypothetical protein BB559_005608 [Furculomyces boomerangus]PVU89907.1 hypothetical protein BB559_004873 [Furculomyces boomerangus]
MNQSKLLVTGTKLATFCNTQLAKPNTRLISSLTQKIKFNSKQNQYGSKRNNSSLGRTPPTTTRNSKLVQNKSFATLKTKENELVPGIWTPQSVRVGALGKKVGMTSMWDEWGVRIPVTVIQLEGVQVVSVVKTSTENLYRLQVGAGFPKPKKITRPMLGHFRKYKVPARTNLTEFPVTKDALLPSGTKITAAHFVPGQLVDVTGTSKGKGFAGVMKRWGFAGGRASHGASLSHRSGGSTGQNQDPGRVFPGKKMSGKMGNKHVTVMELKVMKIDTKLNCIYVKGCIPGNKKGLVKIRDAIKKNKKTGPLKKFPKNSIPPKFTDLASSETATEYPIPFPTYIPGTNQLPFDLPRELIARTGGKDPLLLKQ